MVNLTAVVARNRRSTDVEGAKYRSHNAISICGIIRVLAERFNDKLGGAVTQIIARLVVLSHGSGRRMSKPTKRFNDASKGASRNLSTETRQWLAFFLNPAPGNHSGTYFTEQECTSVETTYKPVVDSLMTHEKE